MNPIDVLILLAGITALALIIGWSWQKWEEFKLARDGVLETLDDVRYELVKARLKLEKILNA